MARPGMQGAQPMTRPGVQPMQSMAVPMPSAHLPSGSAAEAAAEKKMMAKYDADGDGHMVRGVGRA